MEIEALGQIEVALDRRVLPLAAERVADFVVDLRPVERAAALVELELDADARGRLLERVGRHRPDLVVADRLLLRARREVRGVLEAEGREDRVHELADAR